MAMFASSPKSAGSSATSTSSYSSCNPYYPAETDLNDISFSELAKTFIQAMKSWMETANNPETGCTECTQIYDCGHDDVRQNKKMKTCHLCLDNDVDKRKTHIFSASVIYAPYSCPECRATAAAAVFLESQEEENYEPEDQGALIAVHGEADKEQETDEENEIEALAALIEEQKLSDILRLAAVKEQWAVKDRVIVGRLADEAEERAMLQADKAGLQAEEAFQADCRLRWDARMAKTAREQRGVDSIRRGLRRSGWKKGNSSIWFLL